MPRVFHRLIGSLVVYTALAWSSTTAPSPVAVRAPEPSAWAELAICALALGLLVKLVPKTPKT